MQNNLVRSALDWYGHRKTITHLSIALIGFIMLPLYYLFYGYLFYFFFVMPVVLTAHHEFLAHEYVVPKNKVVEAFVYFIFICYAFTNLKNKKNYHHLHHKYYLLDISKDPTITKMNNCSWWQYILDLGPATDLNLNTIEERETIINNLWVFFNKNWLPIVLVTHFIWLSIFPIWTWFVFWLYPSLIGGISAKILDLYFHGRVARDDFPFLVFLVGAQGWHNTHHKSAGKIYMGDKKWKYLNPQYYAVKFLFTYHNRRT